LGGVQGGCQQLLSISVVVGVQQMANISKEVAGDDEIITGGDETTGLLAAVRLRGLPAEMRRNCN